MPTHGATSAAIAEARDAHWEEPARAQEIAARCLAAARTADDRALRARALAVQGVITLNRGDMRGAITLAVEAERDAEACGDPVARCETAALKAELAYFSGSYTDALHAAQAAIEIADGVGDPALRVFARRSACLVMGNLDADGWYEELDELIRTSIELGDRWQEAMSRNDLGHWLMTKGRFDESDAELWQAIAILEDLAPRNALGLAVVHCTRSELRLQRGRPEEALWDAERSLELLARFDEPHPYVFGMTVKLEVQALLGLRRPGDAKRSGERAVARLGDRVPQARSMILAAVAQALRESGRIEEAYDTLERGAELERAALQELIELRLGLERATLETTAARHEADALAVKNRELEEVVGQLHEAHAALQERTAQLERLQDQLREQADRDPLTGLHNRRYLMSRLDDYTHDPLRGPVSIAVLDLDHFKAVNDAFGHAAGDQVLIRAAALLRAVVRTTDVVARTGGEEFVIVMPDTDAEAATRACDRVLELLREETWHRIADNLRVTASAGVATAEAGADAVDLERLTNLADSRLYEAKRKGRDRVVAVQA